MVEVNDDQQHVGVVARSRSGIDLVAWVELRVGLGARGAGRDHHGHQTRRRTRARRPRPPPPPRCTCPRTRPWTPADVVLGTRAVPALAPGATDSGSTNVTLPTTLTGGTYYVIGKADGPGVIAETNETNNAMGPARAVLVGADMVVTLDVPGAYSAVSVGRDDHRDGHHAQQQSRPRPWPRRRSSISRPIPCSTPATSCSARRAVPALAAFTEHSAQTALTLPAGLGGIVLRDRPDRRRQRRGRGRQDQQHGGVRGDQDRPRLDHRHRPSGVRLARRVPGATITVTDVTREQQRGSGAGLHRTVLPLAGPRARRRRHASSAPASSRRSRRTRRAASRRRSRCRPPCAAPST